MKSKRAGGFTLVELMIVIVIFAVLLGLAIPAFSSIRFTTKLRSYASEMTMAIYTARSESLKRNQSITLCPTTDGASCADTEDWSGGWLVVDPDAVVLKVGVALANGFILDGKELGSDTAVKSVVFRPSGLVVPAADFVVCMKTPSIGDQERVIELAPSGRVVVETTRNGNCGEVPEA